MATSTSYCINEGTNQINLLPQFSAAFSAANSVFVNMGLHDKPGDSIETQWQRTCWLLSQPWMQQVTQDSYDQSAQISGISGGAALALVGGKGSVNLVDDIANGKSTSNVTKEIVESNPLSNAIQSIV